MSLTAAAFVASLTGMTVTGVNRVLTNTPQQVDTAYMPFMYPRLPEAGNEIASFTGVPGLDTVTVELVVVVEAWAQSTSALNFAAAVAVTDNLTAALKTKMAATQTIDTWRITQDIATVGTGNYWAIVATVTGSA